MRIEFESREEIQKLATILQSDIFPTALVIDVDNLRDACRGDGDLPLPWDVDGFHLPLMPVVIEDEKVDKKVHKKVHQVGADKKVDNERLYTHQEVFGRNHVWEEIQVDGKKYLQQVISSTPPFRTEEEMIYLAGQLDTYFQLTQNGQTTTENTAKITGHPEALLVDLCRIWNRRMCGKSWGRKWFGVHPDGNYTINDDPNT